MRIEIRENSLKKDNNIESVKDNFNEKLYQNGKMFFEQVIIDRGRDYYEKGMVLSVVRDYNNNKFYANVRGHNNNIYKVVVLYEIVPYDVLVEFECDCPCEFECKHAYAVLLAIREGKYVDIKLKEEVNKNELPIYEILKDIPAIKIKEYLLSNEGIRNVSFNKESFKNTFRQYYPVDSYEYYYNNLYNAVVLCRDSWELLTNYFGLVVDYFSNNMFEEAFKIMKSIIEVYHDTNRMYSKEFIVDIFPKIAMFIRVTFKNCNSKLREEMILWAVNIEKEKYYDSIFLQDVIESIK